jgi:hypothetical protein
MADCLVQLDMSGMACLLSQVVMKSAIAGSEPRTSAGRSPSLAFDGFTRLSEPLVISKMAGGFRFEGRS